MEVGRPVRQRLLRRWWPAAAVLVAILGAGQVVLHSISRSRPIREVPLEQCLVQWERCQADGVYIVGAYAPGSKQRTADCPSEIVMQSPGGREPGTLRVCDRRRSGEVADSASICWDAGDTAMLRVVANGYYTLRVRGRLEGSVFQAQELQGGGCESKYYAWRYGNDAIGEPR